MGSADHTSKPWKTWMRKRSKLSMVLIGALQEMKSQMESFCLLYDFFRTTVLEPISRFCAYFPDINECIKKRNHKLLDYDAMRSKVKRLVDKPDKDVTKLPRAEKEAEMAKQAYEQLNEQLFTELPQLIDLRVPYLDPSFEALVKIQLRFCAEAYSRMAQVQQYLDADTRDQYARGDLDNRVEQVLQEIRDLTIAGSV
jgi:bridging integrator 3